MATIQRPLKEGSVRTYQEKVGLGFLDILASEMDADLDTIFAAWNGGADTINIKDGSVTAAKLATDAKPWTLGTTIFPADPTKSVDISGGEMQLRLGQRTQKGRVGTLSAQDWLGASLNARWSGTNWPQDDSAQPSWLWNFGGDAYTIARAPAGNVSPAPLLKLDNAGTLTVGGAGAPRINLGLRSVWESWDGGIGSFYINESSTIGYNVAQSGWSQRFDYVNNRLTFNSRPASSGTFSPALTLEGSGLLTTVSAVRIGGNASGIRCQNVGTMSGDGYSNAIAFGWDGTLKARVDSTIIGTVTVTSDARVKLDTREDVPGLDAVQALRPISFEYDQTAREIGFPKGRRYGLIAQEAEPIVPFVIEEEGEFLSIDYRTLVPVLIRAIQELAARIP